MAGTVRNDLATMQATATHIKNVSSQIQSEITGVRNLVDGATHWGGSAKGAFNTVMEDFNSAAVNLKTILEDKIAANIEKNGVGYDQQEQDIQAQVLKAGASGELGSSLNIKL
ncbi:WXG100 family type VII secretion target [Nocardia cyriacigeorgica]|uniref:WXG100 family type VII secretion target n=2 Tax=Nocardia cyriacigeorgica TaxID=135487 RepID=A0A6P1DFZ0_9NOCA|nr:WXG100 family type VII secretion target [Nocardia cyriacigeorgica]NEW57345.1 WXG100 family type VII secretion target [Nocardia cyriacigeorgica]